MIAFVSPLGHVGEELLWVHMVQHLVIGDVAALLICLGLTRAVLAPVLAIRFFDRLRVLGLPYVALPLWIANLFIWHIPVLYEGAVNHSGIHALEHACFIGFGIALWMPVAGPLPVPRWFGGGAQVGYTVVARLAGAVLGNIFMWSGTVLYPVYVPGDQYWGISPLTDQGIAGIVMLIESGIVTLAILAWAMLRWAARDAEKQRLLDLADNLGVPLTRAGRREPWRPGTGPGWKSGSGARERRAPRRREPQPLPLRARLRRRHQHRSARRSQPRG